MIQVVGIGPGGREYITPKAEAAIRNADVVVGYTFYLELIDFLLQGKETVSTGMTREVDRCMKAVELALTGKRVAVVSTGDPGVYGMAGLVLELLEKEDPKGKVEVEIVPGISAAGAAASLLGAPLMSDYAVISLSDLLTPWATIERRLKAAAEGDFVVTLYNPRSKKRKDHLERALAILGSRLPSETPVGIVRNALRDDQRVTISTIARAATEEIDMMCVVVVGNSATRIINGKMVTPRGYGVEE